MQFGFCELAVVPVRREASDRSEMLTQLLFGDILEILDRSGSWLLIKNFSDKYEGWVDIKQVRELDKDHFDRLTTAQVSVNRNLNTDSVMVNDQRILLPAGCSFYDLKDQHMKIGDMDYLFDGQAFPYAFSGIENLLKTALSYLSCPYLWGGKTYLGLDCSGFTQLIYKQHGIGISRDATQQAEQGEAISFVSDGLPGDLLFFDNGEGEIVHVGILLDNQQVLHCSGKVRIDEIDHQGIFNRELNKYSHNLRLIKRVIFI